MSAPRAPAAANTGAIRVRMPLAASPVAKGISSASPRRVYGLSAGARSLWPPHKLQNDRRIMQMPAACAPVEFVLNVETLQPEAAVFFSTAGDAAEGGTAAELYRLIENQDRQPAGRGGNSAIDLPLWCRCLLIFCLNQRLSRLVMRGK